MRVRRGPARPDGVSSPRERPLPVGAGGLGQARRGRGGGRAGACVHCRCLPSIALGVCRLRVVHKPMSDLLKTECAYVAGTFRKSKWPFPVQTLNPATSPLQSPSAERWGYWAPRGSGPRRRCQSPLGCPRAQAAQVPMSRPHRPPASCGHRARAGRTVRLRGQPPRSPWSPGTGSLLLASLRPRGTLPGTRGPRGPALLRGPCLPPPLVSRPGGQV